MASKSLHYQGGYRIDETEKGYRVYPKFLNIVWGKDARFWKIPQNETDAAELIQVNWLEVTGYISNMVIAKKTSYDIEFTMSFMFDAFGWNDSPVYLMAKWGDNTQWRKVNFTSHEINGKNTISKTITVTKEKENNTNKIDFGLYEVWNKKWKGGLKIHHVNLKETERS